MKGDGDNIRQELYRHHADMCKVFSHPTRLRILNTLRREELSVSDLVDRLGIPLGSVSQHLNIMKQKRVLDSLKRGNTVRYRLANPKMLRAFDLIREILQEQLQRDSRLARHLRRTRHNS